MVLLYQSMSHVLLRPRPSTVSMVSSNIKGHTYVHMHMHTHVCGYQKCLLLHVNTLCEMSMKKEQLSYSLDHGAK